MKSIWYLILGYAKVFEWSNKDISCKLKPSKNVIVWELFPSRRPPPPFPLLRSPCSKKRIMVYFAFGVLGIFFCLHKNVYFMSFKGKKILKLPVVVNFSRIFHICLHTFEKGITVIKGKLTCTIFAFLSNNASLLSKLYQAEDCLVLSRYIKRQESPQTYWNFNNNLKSIGNLFHFINLCHLTVKYRTPDSPILKQIICRF